MIDRDEMDLIHRLMGITRNDANNLLKLLLMMINLKSADEFMHLLFEIVDEGQYIQVVAGEYNTPPITIPSNDAELDKLLLTVGNDLFANFAQDSVLDHTEMVINLISALLDTRLYVKVESTEEFHHNVEMAEKNS